MTERTIKDMTYPELAEERDRLRKIIPTLHEGCRVRNHYILRLQAVEQELGVTVDTMADKWI